MEDVKGLDDCGVHGKDLQGEDGGEDGESGPGNGGWPGAWKELEQGHGGEDEEGDEVTALDAGDGI